VKARVEEAEYWHSNCECDGRYCLGQIRINAYEKRRSELEKLLAAPEGEK